MATDPGQQPAPAASVRPRPRRRPRPAAVIWGSLGLFAVLFSLLTYQLSSAWTATTQVTKRPIVVRKVIRRRVVTTLVPSATGGTTRTASSLPATSAVSAAPAPAPVTTSAS